RRRNLRRKRGEARMLEAQHGRTLLRIAFVGALIVIAVMTTAESSAPSLEGLDWTAPYRWVHIDNVDAAKAVTFEGARTDGLRVLGKGDRWLDDGRALFWHARTGPVQTFVTLYPFRRFGDLDARRETVGKTN